MQGQASHLRRSNPAMMRRSLLFRSASRWRVALHRIRVAVAVEDCALERLTELRAACLAQGFDLETELAGVGVFVGSVHPVDIERLRAIPGVAAVEPERPVRTHAMNLRCP